MDELWQTFTTTILDSVELDQKLEFARESYNVKFLNEKFENKEDNKVRKDKLNKLLEKIYVKKSSPIRES